MSHKRFVYGFLFFHKFRIIIICLYKSMIQKNLAIDTYINKGNLRKRPANAYCHCNRQSLNSGQQNERSECDWSKLQTSYFCS